MIFIKSQSNRNKGTYFTIYLHINCGDHFDKILEHHGSYKQRHRDIINTENSKVLSSFFSSLQILMPIDKIPPNHSLLQAEQSQTSA